MGTLYIRDVDNAAIEVLKQRAAAAGMSLSAYVGAELTKMAERPTNAEVAERLRTMDRTNGLSREEILAALHESRR